MRMFLLFGLALCAWATDADLRAWMDRAIAEGQAPGAVIAVSRHGRPVFTHAAGMADIESRRPMRADEIFMIASSTKPVSAAAILTLADRGKLSLDDRVSKYFPEFAGTSTIRQLLSHTSGIFGNDGKPEQVKWIRDFDISLKESVEAIVRMPLAYDPGSKYSYGGASIGVAGRVAEMLSGMDFEEHTRKVMFEPLGMTDTCFRSSQDLSGRVATIYSKTADVFRPMPSVMEKGRRGPRPDGFVLVAGGIYSTASDMLKYWNMQLSNGKAGGKRILSEAMIAEMRRKQTGGLATEYGLGVQRIKTAADGAPVMIGHGGAYGTDIWIDLETGIAAAIMIQMPNAQGKPFVEEARRRILQEFGGAIPK